MQSESAQTLISQIMAGFNEIDEALGKVVNQTTATAQATIIVAACKRLAEIAEKLNGEIPPEEMARLHSINTSVGERVQAEMIRLSGCGQADALASALTEAWDDG